MEFKFFQKELELQSRGWIPTFHDISKEVKEIVAESGIINHLNFDNGPSRFCPNLTPHVHLLDDTNNRVLDVQLKPGLRPEDVFDLPEGTCVTRMDACLHGKFPL